MHLHRAFNQKPTDHIHDPSENHFRDVSIVTSESKLVTAETTLVLQSPTIVGLGVNMHGRLGSFL